MVYSVIRIFHEWEHGLIITRLPSASSDLQ